MPILWGLSGPVTVFGLTLPRALFWVAFIYVFLATVVAFWIGRPLIRLSFRNELTNAAFRYALVRLRDAAEAVGFYRGENTERGLLKTRYDNIITNYRAFVRRTLSFTGWNLAMSQIITPLPLIVQAPRLFKRRDGLRRCDPIRKRLLQYQRLAVVLPQRLRPVRRLSRRRSSVCTASLRPTNWPARCRAWRPLPATDGSVELDRVEVRTPGGSQLVDPLDLRSGARRGVWWSPDAPAAGKTTLLRSLAQMWPYTSGTVRRPIDEHQTMFLSQLPYVPLGDLRTVVSYPAQSGRDRR